MIISLKPTGVPPGDVTADQMDAIANLADRYSFGELRVTHEQNLVLADVRQSDLEALWQALRALGLATPNIGLLTDMICCPGGDFCTLANARSIPVAAAIQERFDDLDYLYDLGDLELKISGCMNSCGHHHVGHIGILGVDKPARSGTRSPSAGIRVPPAPRATARARRSAGSSARPSRAPTSPTSSAACSTATSRTATAKPSASSTPWAASASNPSRRMSTVRPFFRMAGPQTLGSNEGR